MLSYNTEWSSISLLVAISSYAIILPLSYEVDVTMDAATYVRMMKERVFHAIRRKIWWCSKVVMQHDGASAHTGKGAEDALRAAGVGRRMTIDIARQPPNSPDCNILDLCFNRSLACRVSRLPTANKARLVAAVAAEWQRYDSQTLERAWRYKSLILRSIIAADGGNDFKLPHRSDFAAEDLAPITATADELAALESASA